MAVSSRKKPKDSATRPRTAKRARPRPAAAAAVAPAKARAASKPAKTRSAAAPAKARAAAKPARPSKKREASTPASTRSVAKPASKESAKALARGRISQSRATSLDKLAKYRSKRDFGRTPEPEGKPTGTWKKTGNPYFVIQKHAASRLHYDFRLEVDGVLKSWAVPKGPSMDPQVKRLAVEVEDHPVEYADFEGIIPKDEYGGGTVIVWDAGPYRNLKTKAGKEIPMSACHEKGQIEIWLEGKKIRGGFALVHTRMDEQGKNWLLIKMKDKAAGDADPVSEQQASVISGRTIEEVAGKPGRVWSSR